ncbi:MAG: hypothetical protein D3920_15920 [Candidatus Electrothrix sp. AW2]|nr:hypothetical protein [Candidatus Electrothrix gigas]
MSNFLYKCQPGYEACRNFYKKKTKPPEIITTGSKRSPQGSMKSTRPNWKFKGRLKKLSKGTQQLVASPQNALNEMKRHSKESLRKNRDVPNLFFP